MKIIGIAHDHELFRYRLLFDALENIFDVRFEQHIFTEGEKVDAWFIHDIGNDTFKGIKNINCPCFMIVKENNLVECGESNTIEFTKHPSLARILQGRDISNEEVIDFKALPSFICFTDVIAAKKGLPIWVTKSFQHSIQHIVSLSLPELKEGEQLYQHFCGSQFLRLLPLWTFLQNLKDGPQWEAPELMSCFMFDDPNLHWRTYGFINFSEIALNAEGYNYHVSFATVPMDSWFFHKPTVELFRMHNNRISLLVHGNDHAFRELYRTTTASSCRRIAQQSIERISRFERRAGVEVSRIIAPPHGVFNQAALAELTRVGFEAACMPRGALRRLNVDKKSSHILGMAPSDIIGGLTIINRSSLSKNSVNNILVAALLNQPMILAGHHQDVSEGLHLLQWLAEFINSLGFVKWDSMKNISRSHYTRRISGSLLHINMHTKHIELCVPEGIEHVLVERSWLKGVGSEPLAWRTNGGNQEYVLQETDKPISTLPGTIIEIVSGEPILNVVEKSNVRNIHPWHFLRRQITEARDRIAPAIKYFVDL